ncbi:hypothetical protein WJX72_003585 [[Myrmecia] bisecta]|uniref:RNA exonuclease 4 n=1 Tax=[Myrmecia] bisecta TaxID=41462 RepID=A0AAW1R5W1_9CHLO
MARLLPPLAALSHRSLQNQQLRITVVAVPGKGGVSSNWASLKVAIGAGGKRPRPTTQAIDDTEQSESLVRRPEKHGSAEGLTAVLAIDCEMVGVGPDGKRSALARVCIVNSAGHVLMDKHVRPKEPVTDFRTQFSGIRPADLKHAESLEDVQAEVARLIQGRILVGHSISNDLQALLLGHPRKDIRDTARYPPLMRATAPGRRPKPRALRHLAAEQLGLTIQEGEHTPVDDARAALYLYLKHRKDWERSLKTGGLKQLAAPRLLKAGQKRTGKTLAELAANDDMADL